MNARIHYFVPTAADVAAARASNCPGATPMDSRDCIGRVCCKWNAGTDTPCDGFRGHKDYSVTAVMTGFFAQVATLQSQQQ